MLLSTGMSTEEEVRRTLAFLDRCGAEYALFHCVSTYPAAPEEINLRFMERLREWSGPAGRLFRSRHGDRDFARRRRRWARACSSVISRSTARCAVPITRRVSSPMQFAEQVSRAARSRAVAGRPAPLDHARRDAEPPRPGQERRGGGRHSCEHRDFAHDAHEQEPGPRAVAAVHRQAGRPSAAAADCARRDVSSGGHRRRGYRSRGDGDRRRRARGASWRGFSISRRSNRRSRRSGCDSSSSTSAIATSTPGRRRTRAARKPFGFVVHAPEYAHDTLIDLCAVDDAQRALSIARIQKTIDLARELAPQFQWDARAVPARPEDRDARRRHVRRRRTATIVDGGLGPAARRAEAARHRAVSICCSRTSRRIRGISADAGSDTCICDADNTVALCRASGLGLCFDTSHAALECAKSGASLLDFAAAIAPYLRHLHVSDGAGTSGEGLQIGDGVGELRRAAADPARVEADADSGDLDGTSRERAGLPDRARASHRNPLGRVVLGRRSDRRARPDLRALTVMDDATIFTALRVIDMQRMGIAFVLDRPAASSAS